MKSVAAAACAVVALAAQSASISAQVGNPASPTVGRPMTSPSGPPAPVRPVTVEPRTGPLPSSLTLAQSLDEAAARSPTLVAAEAEVAAAEARIVQAGYRENPELSLEVENFAGTGELRGVRSLETTLAVNQRLDLGGRRSARIGSARAALDAQKLRLAIARADLSLSVREQFARAVAAREKLTQANETVDRARELARVAGILVDAGRDPPLRGLRARSALAQAQAEREAAVADELAARSSLAALFGISAPVETVIGKTTDFPSQQVFPAPAWKSGLPMPSGSPPRPRCASSLRNAGWTRQLELACDTSVKLATSAWSRVFRCRSESSTAIAGISMQRGKTSPRQTLVGPAHWPQQRLVLVMPLPASMPPSGASRHLRSRLCRRPPKRFV